MRMPVRLLKKRESWNPLKHPFITLGVLSLLCVFITGEHPLWLLPAAGFALAGTGLTLYMAHSLPQKTKRPFVLVLTAFFWGLGGISFLMLEGAKKPALVLLNLGLPLVAVLGAYWLCRRMLTTRRAVLLLMAAGFLLRLAYVLTFSIYQKQHDAGSLESMDGHIGYIATLAFHGALPDIDVRTVYQFYHPPCHHIIAALWVRLQVLLGVGRDEAFENVQLLTLMYSSFCMVLCCKIFRAMGLKGRGLPAAMAVVAFCPTFLILGGSINNDLLSVTLLLGALLNTLYWYKNPTLPRILCVAVCFGLGMMTKLSVWMTAPAIGFLFLYGFYRLPQRRKQFVGQFAAFLLVSVPLSLWWGIRNLVSYGVPITYVMRLSENSEQYVGNIPVYQRLFDFRWFQFEQVGEQFLFYKGTYSEYNPLIGLMKTSLFDETFTTAYYPRAAGFDKFLFWAGVAAALLAAASMVFVWVRDKSMPFPLKVFTGLVYEVFLGMYYSFCLTYPHVCTQNIRYAVVLIVWGAFFLGKAAGLLFGQKEKKPAGTIGYAVLCSAAGVYACASLAFYECVMM